VKKVISSVILAGMACAVFATDARVETMGGHSNFFADETSIHKNPANMGLYDNIMYGSYGSIARNTDWTTGMDWRPEMPHFGGVISFGQKEGSPSRVSIGATFNRVDSALNYVAFNLNELGLRTDKKGNSFLFAEKSGMLDFVGKIDLMAAYTLPNGTTIGLGGYLALQDGAARDLNPNWRNMGGDVSVKTSPKELQNRFVKGNLGVNTSIGDGTDLEASIGISALNIRGSMHSQRPDNAWEAKGFGNAAQNDVGIEIAARMFSDIPAINGAFVPHIQANIFNYGDNDNIIDFKAGLGLNVNIDRGFFWTGLEGLFNKKSYALIKGNGSNLDEDFGRKDAIGGRIGFGIERNVLTDWFVIRVGGAKYLIKESKGGDDWGWQWSETDDHDHVSLGMGVNIEDRLKIDFTIAQNLPYTFTSLFSSSGNPYLASRVSAVFTF